jgi:hypothetical protein
MKRKRKYLTNFEVNKYCEDRKKKLGCEACYGCELKLRISASQYCIKEIKDLELTITNFWNDEVEI